MAVALVTGAGRGIGAAIARALAADGWEVVSAARSRAEIDAIATETGARAVQMDVRDHASVEAAVAEAGAVELLVANAGIGHPPGATWEAEPEQWWNVFETNVLGVHLCCRAVIPGMLSRSRGRIVVVGSAAAWLPDMARTAYAGSKAAVCRYAETLANELAGRIPVFVFTPGRVRTAMTEGRFGDDATWTDSKHAACLVTRLARGQYDVLAGLYLHAEQDDVDELARRIDEIRADDLQAIRLRR